MPGIKPASPMETDSLCSFGCGQKASFKNKRGNFICQDFTNKCPAVRSRNRDGRLKLQVDGREAYRRLPDEIKKRMAWAKGLTKDVDQRLKNASISRKGKRKISDPDKLEKIIYKEQCHFNLANIIHLIEGYDLLEKFGMYHRITNKEGVVRDHMVSVDYGWQHKIDPSIISHPANCRFISHKENARKSRTCSISLDELNQRILKWNTSHL